MSDAVDGRARLSALISGAVHDVDVAIAAWESVRRADSSDVLVERINQARVDTSFSVIRQALHTQVLMALARLWDRGNGTIGFSKIAVELAREDVISELAARARASAEGRLVETRDARSGDLISIADPTHFERLRSRLPKVAENTEVAVRVRASEWQGNYDFYRDVRIGAALRELREVRNKRISHWDLADISNGTERTYRLHRLGRILRASELLVEKALLLAKDEHHRFIQTHRLYAAEAKRFWGTFRR